MSEPNWQEFARQRQSFCRAWERGQITAVELAEIEDELDEEIEEILAEDG